MSKIIKVVVRIKPNVSDPQGQAVARAARAMNMTGVKDIRIGKFFELKVEEDVSRATIEELAHKLLSNPVIEDYEILD